MSESAENFIKRTSEKFQKNLNEYKKSHKDCYLSCFPDINRKGKECFIREAWTFMLQFNIEEKVFIIERFKRENIQKPIRHKKLKIGQIEYRFGYYMVGQNGNRIGKWTWGGFCPFIPQEDLKRLINKAETENTIL